MFLVRNIVGTDIAPPIKVDIIRLRPCLLSF